MDFTVSQNLFELELQDANFCLKKINDYPLYIYMPFSRRFYPKRLTVSHVCILRMGGPGNRTHYPGVTSAMLYQLSHRRTTGMIRLKLSTDLKYLGLYLLSIKIIKLDSVGLSFTVLMKNQVYLI